MYRPPLESDICGISMHQKPLNSAESCQSLGRRICQNSAEFWRFGSQIECTEVEKHKEFWIGGISVSPYSMYVGCKLWGQQGREREQPLLLGSGPLSRSLDLYTCTVLVIHVNYHWVILYVLYQQSKVTFGKYFRFANLQLKEKFFTSDKIFGFMFAHV